MKFNINDISFEYKLMKKIFIFEEDLINNNKHDENSNKKGKDFLNFKRKPYFCIRDHQRVVTDCYLSFLFVKCIRNSN